MSTRFDEPNLFFGSESRKPTRLPVDARAAALQKDDPVVAVFDLRRRAVVEDRGRAVVAHRPRERAGVDDVANQIGAGAEAADAALFPAGERLGQRVGRVERRRGQQHENQSQSSQAFESTIPPP